MKTFLFLSLVVVFGLLLHMDHNATISMVAVAQDPKVHIEVRGCGANGYFLIRGNDELWSIARYSNCLPCAQAKSKDERFVCFGERT